MNNKIANIKLESFFQGKKFTKKASLGYFSDVITEEDLKAISTMVYKMVMLPKYAKVKEQLKSTNGIVNFVTYDEFEPLVEMIFKTSIPPSANDVYHMGQGFTLPEDYFVDAKGFFGAQSADPAVSQAALSRMEQTIKGSPKKMTREWLKRNGLDPDGDAFASVFGDAAAPLREALEAYKKNINDLQNSDLKTEIDELFRKLDKDRVMRKRAKEVENFNQGKPEAQRQQIPKLLSKEEINALRIQLRLKRGFYARALAGVENAADILEIPKDMFSHESEYNNDGFLGWSPEDEIRKVYIDILESTEATEAQMQIKFSNLQMKLEDYRTTDPDLIQRRQKVLDFLQVENAVQKYQLNSGTFTRLMNEFISRANQHGKIMIFKGVDNSALTSAPLSANPQQEASGVKLNNWGVLSDFIAANNANMVRDMQGGKRTARGKRTIILISSVPLTNMPPGSSVIEMDVSPVDEAEAAIIVNALIDAYVNDAAAATTLKMAYDIEKKYSGATDSQSLAKKDIETSQIDQLLVAAKTSLAYVSPEGRRKIEQMVIGMGQKAAISKVREVLATHAQYEKDEDGILSGITFDENVLLKDMIEEITKAKAEDVPGLRLRESKVKFKDYITKKGSGWGNEVGTIAFRCQSLGFYNEEIVSARKEIAQIDFELRDSKLTPATKREKLESRKLWELELQRYIALKDGVIQDIPHYMVLRGKPGVGKCFGKGTKVLLFDGRVDDVENIVEGDLLMGPDSRPRKVISTTKGVGPLFKVSQKLGENFICNDAHILSLQSTDKPSDQEPVFVSAEDFCKKNKTWKYRHKGWKVGVEFPGQDLPIDPYWMGLWLGDGLSRYPAIVVGDKDVEIHKWLENWAKGENLFIRKEKQPGCEVLSFSDIQGSRSGCVSNHIKTHLRSLNLLQNKHIPDIYWNNSSKNRLSLLAGLIDSDGYRCKSGSIQFTNINETLAINVLNLARSLGFRATFSESIKTIKSIGYKVLAYTVTIGGTLSRIPTKLPRKQGHDNPQKKSLRYAISVDPIGEGEYYGFMIDGDHQFLLGDYTVTHNSVWGDALADLLGYLIYNVDISDVFDKWLGNSEKNTNKLIETIFNSRNAVFLIDEVDRMLDMGSGDSSGGGEGAGGHPTEKKVIAKFLEAFGERTAALMERNVFVIMTTNHVNSIDNALLKRAKGDVYDVQASDDPQDFLKFLETFLETERRDTPNNPWIRSGGTTNKEMWDYTIRFIKENIDLQKLATIFATRELSFRSLSGLISKACKKHNAYINEFLGAIARGDPATPTGMPMTTANLANVARLVEDSAEDATKADLHFDDVYGQVIAEANAAWPKIQLEEIQVPHPVTGKMQKQFKLPDSIQRIMEGREETEEDQPQFEVSEEEVTHPDDPNVKRRQVFLQPTAPGQKIRELTDDGMQEDMLEGPDQEKIETGEGKPPTKKKQTQGKVTSSTEYLYSFLRDKGVIDDNGIVVSKKKEVNEVQNTVPNVPQAFDSVEQYGTYYFNDGQVFVMSVSDGMPPLSFYN